MGGFLDRWIRDSWNSSFREGGEDLAAGFGFDGLLGGALGGGEFVVVLFLPEGEFPIPEVGLAEAGELVGHFADVFPAFIKGRAFTEPPLPGVGEFSGGDGGHGVDDFPGVNFLVWGFRLFGELEGEVAGFLEFDPILIPARAPFGEVLLGDAAAGVVLREDALGFGFGVEPGEEFVAGDAVVQAVVEVVAEGEREVGDFAVTGCSHRSVQCSRFRGKIDAFGLALAIEYATSRYGFGPEACATRFHFQMTGHLS